MKEVKFVTFLYYRISLLVHVLRFIQLL